MRLILSVLVLLALTATSAVAAAPSANILTVDVQKILQDSTAAQSIRKQLDAQRDKYQVEIKKEEDRLRATEQALMKEQSKLTKDQLAEKQKSLRADFRVVERKVQQRRRALDQAFAEAMKRIRTALAEVVIDTAKERGANIVLPKAETMWHAPELEITDVVLQKLNTKLPNVKVTIVENAAAGQAAEPQSEDNKVE